MHRKLGMTSRQRLGVALNDARRLMEGGWQCLHQSGAERANLIAGKLGKWRAGHQGGSRKARLTASALLMTVAITILASIAISLVEFARGYLWFSTEALQARILHRRAQPVYSADGQFFGLASPPGRQSLDFEADYAFAAIDAELPPSYRPAVIDLEQRTLGSWRSSCGIDLLSTLARMATLRGGGSGLAQQAAKELLKPDQNEAGSKLARLLQKPFEAGVACRLHQATGGAEGMLRLYAEIAPVLQGNGTARGILAGSWTLFGKGMPQLSDAEQIVLAAAHQLPIAPLVPHRGCQAPEDPAARINAPKDTPRPRLCRMLARARVAAGHVLQGDRLARALDEMARFERTGFTVNTRLTPSLRPGSAVNPSRLAGETVGRPARQRLEAEIEALPGTRSGPIALSLDSGNLAFRHQVDTALQAIDVSAAGRRELCVRLAKVPLTPMPICPGVDQPQNAQVLLVRMNVRTGNLKSLYERGYAPWDAHIQWGSLWKQVLMLAAVQAGWGPDSRVCPRAVTDQGRRLRRTTAPVHGFDDCKARNLLSLREAAATSDSLAFYELARQLGDDRLRQTAAMLDLDPDRGTPLAFGMAFGTQTATPSQMLVIGQALYAAAYGLDDVRPGPRLLRGDAPPSVAARRVAVVLSRPRMRQQLRELLQAPVNHPRGTLHSMAGVLDAGKSGTTSSTLRANATARPYVAGKLIMGFSSATQDLFLFALVAQDQGALADHRMGWQTLQPLLQPALPNRAVRSG